MDVPERRQPKPGTQFVVKSGGLGAQNEATLAAGAEEVPAGSILIVLRTDNPDRVRFMWDSRRYYTFVNEFGRQTDPLTSKDAF